MISPQHLVFIIITRKIDIKTMISSYYLVFVIIMRKIDIKNMISLLWEILIFFLVWLNMIFSFFLPCIYLYYTIIVSLSNHSLSIMNFFKHYLGLKPHWTLLLYCRGVITDNSCPLICKSWCQFDSVVFFWRERHRNFLLMWQNDAGI